MKLTIKAFEAFSGIGAQRKALQRLGIKHEVVAISEVDKFAIKSYEAIHGKVNNLGDITQINVSDVPNHDLFTYSFPCQDISVAGKGKGLDEDSETRSSLLWHCRKIIACKKPKYLLLENVKNLVGKKNKANFDKWLDWLETQGYTNYWQVLNAKDYGIPQNRERVFVVSVLGEHEPFQFPEKQELKLRLKDLLECEVDEKFYLSDEKVNQLIANIEGRIDLNRQVIGTCHKKNDLSFATRDRVYNQEQLSPTLTSTMHKDAPKVLQIENVVKSSWQNPQVGRVYDSKGLSPALDTMQGGNRQPKIVENVGNVNPSGKGMNGNVFYEKGLSPTLTTNKGEGPKVLIKNATEKGYLEAVEGDGIDLAYPESQTRRGRLQKRRAHTITTSDNLGVLEGFRIRKLAPLECWRLMGFDDADFYKAQAVNSNSQLYKQAGNSIVVDVLEAIFGELFKAERAGDS